MREARARYLVKPGIKQTEVGTTPSDWEAKQLRDFQPFVTSGSRGWAAYYSEIGAPFIRITNLSRESIYPDLADTRYVSVPPNDVEGIRTRLRTGDVLISITADIGIVGYVSDEIPTPAYINQHIALVRFNPLEVCPKYISYFLASGDSQKAFQALTDSGAKSGKNLTTVSNIWAALPPTVEEQQAIADALGGADALIESLEHLLAKKRQIKQGTMQALLTGQLRLPGFEGEWEDKSLIELAQGKKELFDDGDWVEAEHIVSSGIRLVQTGNIGVGRFLEKDDRKYVSESSFVSLRCKQIHKGDLLICRLADPAGRACVLPDIEEERMITSVDVTIFRPSEDEIDRRFLANVFSATAWFQAVSDRCGGTTHKRISRNSLGQIRLKLPPLAEQTAIATVLADMDAEIAALDAKLAKARALKQGMMQTLLTGRIRLV